MDNMYYLVKFTIAFTAISAVSAGFLEGLKLESFAEKVGVINLCMLLYYVLFKWVAP